MPLTRPHVRIAAFGVAALVLVACNGPDEPALSESAHRPVTEESSTAVRTGDGHDDLAHSGRAGTSPSSAGLSNAGSPEELVTGAPPGAGVATPTRTGAVQTALTAGEVDFMRTLAGHSLYEMQAARLALDKARDPAVKSLASMLVTHHAQSSERLRKLAASRELGLPSELPDDKRQALSRLSQSQGAVFDRQFVQTVGVEGHETGIALFSNAAQDARDAEVRRFIQDTLPSLRSHLATARTLAASGPDTLPTGSRLSPRSPS